VRHAVAAFLVCAGAAGCTLVLLADALTAIAAVVAVGAVIYGLAGFDVDGSKQ
jgi:hypothetical protein